MMLSNVISIVLAFITVMLLLSLIVMGLVQITQSALRLRARNLLVGIAALIEAEELAPTLTKPTRRTSPRKHAHHAAAVLNATTAAKLRPEQDPNSWKNVLRGPATSWAQPEDIAAAIRARQKDQYKTSAVASGAGIAASPEPFSVADVLRAAEPNLPGDRPDKLAEKFRSLEPAMCDRFARTVQMWTAIWGLAVAIVFQVSTPTLLRTLSTSQARRDAILAMVPGVLKQAESAIPSAMSDDFVDRALTQLAADPIVANRSDVSDVKGLFEQVSGSTDSRQEMVDELRVVLASLDGRDAIVRRYGEIIDNTATHDVQSALATAGGALESLDVIDIRPWGQGGQFYGNGVNIFGVLLTALLLSFGAPFWFEQLKNVASLRDALSKSKAEAK
jgi:hypothetical protein